MVLRALGLMLVAGFTGVFGAGGILGSESVAKAAAFEVATADSPVEFLATGKPGFLKIRGQGAKLKGNAKVDAGVLTGEFAVDLTPLKTGIDLRDEHMKERYLETGKFPDAKLVLDAVKVDDSKGGSDIPFTGKLTIKGKENPVKGTLNVAFAPGAGGARKATGDAKFALRIADYPVGVPSHLGVTVADSVDVSLRFSAAETK
jgi:polyisoprenoid-binding protein YceI